MHRCISWYPVVNHRSVMPSRCELNRDAALALRLDELKPQLGIILQLFTMQAHQRTSQAADAPPLT